MIFKCPCCNSEYEVAYTPLTAPEPKQKRKPKEIVLLAEFGDSKKIRMKQEFYDEIIAEYGKELTEKAVQSMDYWMAANGKSYKDYRAALKGWILRDIDKNPYLKDKMPVAKAEKKVKQFDESHWG